MNVTIDAKADVRIEVTGVAHPVHAINRVKKYLRENPIFLVSRETGYIPPNPIYIEIDEMGLAEDLDVEQHITDPATWIDQKDISLVERSLVGIPQEQRDRIRKALEGAKNG